MEMSTASHTGKPFMNDTKPAGSAAILPSGRYGTAMTSTMARTMGQRLPNRRFHSVHLLSAGGRPVSFGTLRR